MDAAPLLPKLQDRSLRHFGRELAFKLALPVNPTLRRHQSDLPEDKLKQLSAALIEQYFKADLAYLATPEGNQDYWDHMHNRLVENRRRIVPWLDSLVRLSGARILEIGAGTGSSTVAFAEQGAFVAGIDVDAPALEVARVRCGLYDLHSARLEQVNVTDFSTPDGSFDLVVFFASLEHMFHDERIEGLKKAWAMLRPGGFLVVLECPNRLWFFDEHTSRLPFFDWLPDELAYDYSRFSPRPSLRGKYTGGSRDRLRDFLRHGRGASYHEFQLALGDLDHLQVASLGPFLWSRYPAIYLRDHASSHRRLHIRLLKGVLPDINPAFMQPFLNMALRKP